MMHKSILILSAATVFAMGSLTLGADRSPDRYEKRRIPQGGSRYGIVLLPVGDRVDRAGEAPYALTGRDAAKTHRPKLPSHPRGPRSG